MLKPRLAPSRPFYARLTSNERRSREESFPPHWTSTKTDFWESLAKTLPLTCRTTWRTTLFRCKFWLTFRAFHDQLDLQQIALIGWFARARAMLLDKLWAWWKTSNKAKISLLLKVFTRSTLRNNYLQPETNVFPARHVDRTHCKTGNIDQNLQRNNVARQVEGFCMSYFAELRGVWYRSAQRY